MRAAPALILLGCLPALAGSTAGEPISRPEHPRPDLRRNDWQNLNGPWQFCFDPDDRGLAEQWPLGGGPFDRRINVPFPWESRLSGIADASGGPIAWYRRAVDVPESWRGRRVWLCFGAVRGEARVWVDGHAVGRLEDGVGPFAFDITDFVPAEGEARIDVRVDTAGSRPPANDADRSGFPRSSGLWQTVWLEARSPVYVDTVRLTPSQPGGRWIVEAEVDVVGPDGPAEVVLGSPDSTVSGGRTAVDLRDGRGAARGLLEIGDPKPWSPDRPHLYELEITVAGRSGTPDVVHTYFCLRTFARAPYEGSGHECILLNGNPLYLRGAIDPSLNAEGLIAAPSDEFLRRDIERARQLGLNLLKLEGEAAAPRRRYWADKLGVLLWREMPLEMNTWHFRIDDYWIAREHIGQMAARARPGAPPERALGPAQGTAPLVCEHFVAVPPAGGDVSWALRFLVTQLRRHSAIQGHIVGSFYDVPWRRDGLLRFDRSAKEFGYNAFVPRMTPADLHHGDFVGFDTPPIIETSPGEELTLPLFASHYSDRPGPATLRGEVVGTDDYGRPVGGGRQTRDVVWQRGSVTYQTPLRVRVPEGAPFVGALTVELLDADGRRIAANYVNLIAEQRAANELLGPQASAGPLHPTVEVLAPRLVAVRIPPGEFAALRGEATPAVRVENERRGFAFTGSEVEYHIALPGFVRDAIPTQMVLLAEMAAVSADGHASGDDAPDVGVSLWDHEVWRIPLPVDPADSRGVLSHHRRFRQGSYGELVRARVDLKRLPSLREDLYLQESFPLVLRMDEPQMGLIVYGRQLGRYMVDPTLILQTAKQLQRPAGYVSYEPVTLDRHVQ